MPDPFAEVPSQLKFQKLLDEVWTQRLQVTEINQGLNREEFADPSCEFELEHVIGRRSFDRRNNLMIDCMDRITYTAASLMVFMTENTDADDDLDFESTG